VTGRRIHWARCLFPATHSLATDSFANKRNHSRTGKHDKKTGDGYRCNNFGDSARWKATWNNAIRLSGGGF